MRLALGRCGGVCGAGFVSRAATDGIADGCDWACVIARYRPRVFDHARSQVSSVDARSGRDGVDHGCTGGSGFQIPVREGRCGHRPGFSCSVRTGSNSRDLPRTQYASRRGPRPVGKPGNGSVESSFHWPVRPWTFFAAGHERRVLAECRIRDRAVQGIEALNIRCGTGLHAWSCTDTPALFVDGACIAHGCHGVSMRLARFWSWRSSWFLQHRPICLRIGSP